MLPGLVFLPSPVFLPELLSLPALVFLPELLLLPELLFLLELEPPPELEMVLEVEDHLVEPELPPGAEFDHHLAVRLPGPRLGDSDHHHRHRRPVHSHPPQQVGDRALAALG